MNKRNFMFLALLGIMAFHGHGEVRAQDASRWLNVDVNQQNCAPRRAAFFAFENLDKAQIFEKKIQPTTFRLKALGNFILSRTITSVLLLVINLKSFDKSEMKDSVALTKVAF